VEGIKKEKKSKGNGEKKKIASMAAKKSHSS